MRLSKASSGNPGDFPYDPCVVGIMAGHCPEFRSGEHTWGCPGGSRGSPPAGGPRSKKFVRFQGMDARLWDREPMGSRIGGLAGPCNIFEPSV